MSSKFQIPRSEVCHGNIDDHLVCSGGWRGLEIEYDCAESSSEMDRVSDMIGGGNNNVSSESAFEDSNPHVVRVMDEEEGFDHLDKLPDHLLIEILVRVRAEDWLASACVKKRWASLFRGDGLWQTALMKRWPGAGSPKRWPGPISQGSTKRRFTALHVSSNLLAGNKSQADVDVDEVAGHVYLFLKEQLELATPSLSYGLLHGTIIDQFLACGKKSDEAHDVASLIWVAVLGNLEETERTFHLLMRIAEEWEVFLPYPYSKSYAVQWRLFERLFTDFRDCLSQFDYMNVLSRAKHKFELIPPTWLGY